MATRTLIFLALCVLAQSASVPSPKDLQKKLAQVAQQVLNHAETPIDNNVSDPELIDSVNTIQDVQNNLRKKVDPSTIPVKIVAEEVKPVVKNYGIENSDVVTGENVNVKREEVDIEHPGAPQRQEHDTQSPDDVNDEQKAITAIKEGVTNTENLLKQGLDLTNVFADNSSLIYIQESIQNMQQTVTNQINQLNENLQNYFNQGSKPEEEEKGESVPKDETDAAAIPAVKGILNFASIRQEVSANSTGSGPLAVFQNYIQAFQNNFQNGVANLTANIQNYVTNFQGQAAANGTSGSQSDESQTPRPTIWGGIQSQFQNIFNRPGQAQGSPNPSNTQADQPAPANPPGPIVQAIQNNPIYQGVVNLIQRPQQNNKPAQAPATPEKAPAVPENKPEGSNVVPTEEKPQDTKPEGEQKKPAGPIQQIVQRNPIVQGIAGAVQRIQTTITNPEKPRDTAIRGHGGSGGSGGSVSGDSDDSDGVKEVKEPVKEQQSPIEAAPQPEKPEEPQEVKEQIPEKTE